MDVVELRIIDARAEEEGRERRVSRGKEEDGRELCEGKEACGSA
jgi:hypothetical protein